MPKNANTYHIIGAGIAGLFCAKLLKQKNKKTQIVVYEAAPVAGGRCQSFADEEFGFMLDNATHVTIGANKELAEFVADNEWEQKPILWNTEEQNISADHKQKKQCLLKSACNTPYEKIARPIIKTIYKKTFPWNKNKLKFAFSKGNLSQKIINNLSAYADHIYYNSKLIKLDSQFGKAAQLDFGSYQVEIGAEDKVILALDNRHYSKLMKTEELPHNSIINIFYQTSEKIYLPQSASSICVLNGKFDWAFVNNNILSVVISAANNEETPLPELARKIWQEIDILRGVNSAFVPPFKAFKYKYATISQDENTNALRPNNALTEYSNVFIAGDWTMKNHPCCMETAYLSAKRAVNLVLKNK